MQRAMQRSHSQRSCIVMEGRSWQNDSRAVLAWASRRHLRDGGKGAIPPQQKIICRAKRPTRVATSLQDVFHASVMSKQFVCTSVLLNCSLFTYLFTCKHYHFCILYLLYLLFCYVSLHSWCSRRFVGCLCLLRFCSY